MTLVCFGDIVLSVCEPLSDHTLIVSKVGTQNLRFVAGRYKMDLPTPSYLIRGRSAVIRAQRDPKSTPKSIYTVAGFESPHLQVET